MTRFVTLDLNAWVNIEHRAPYGMFETLVVRVPALYDMELVFGPLQTEGGLRWQFEYARSKALV